MAPGERTGWRHQFLEKIVRGYLIGILAAAARHGLGFTQVIRKGKLEEEGAEEEAGGDKGDKKEKAEKKDKGKDK